MIKAPNVIEIERVVEQRKTLLENDNDHKDAR